MAHPKRRQSSTRRDKRRTTKLWLLNWKDATTGELHLYHRHWHEGKLYYRGKVVRKRSSFY